MPLLGRQMLQLKFLGNFRQLKQGFCSFMLGQVFLEFSFVFRVHVLFCFFIVSSQYQCNQLPGNTPLQCLLCVQ